MTNFRATVHLPVSPLSRPQVRYNDMEAAKEYFPIRRESKVERPPNRDKTVQPLNGLKIVIIHMKDRLDDGPPIRDLVEEQLDAYEKVENLGVEFLFPSQGDALYF